MVVLGHPLVRWTKEMEERWNTLLKLMEYLKTDTLQVNKKIREKYQPRIGPEES